MGMFYDLTEGFSSFNVFLEELKGQFLDVVTLGKFIANGQYLVLIGYDLIKPNNFEVE